MDGYAYQSSSHFASFGADHFPPSYSSAPPSPPTYPADPHYPHSAYAPDHAYAHPHAQMRPQIPHHQQLQPHHRHSYPAQQQLQVLTTTADHEHDPAEYTAHPSRPHPPYPFHITNNQQGGSGSSAEQQQQPPLSKQEDGEEHFDNRSGGDILPACTGFNRPLNHHEQERIAHLDRLKFFLATAPARWDASASPDGPLAASASPDDPGSAAAGHLSSAHPALNRFLLPTSEYVSCVLWNGLYHITGTDIVRALVFRFEAFGRPVKNMKKFEEGIFSDLRNLKPGVDACLEEPKVSRRSPSCDWMPLCFDVAASILACPCLFILMSFHLRTARTACSPSPFASSFCFSSPARVIISCRHPNA